MSFSVFPYPKDFEANNPISVAETNGVDEWGKPYLKNALECLSLFQTLDNMFRPIQTLWIREHNHQIIIINYACTLSMCLVFTPFIVNKPAYYQMT